MKEITSSNISHIGYEGTTLTVRFKNGTEWNYHDVPEDVHTALMGADSIGSYFSKKVRGAFRATRKIEEEKS